MREAAMMIQPKGRASEAAEDVEVGSFGRQSQRDGSQRSFAIQSGAAHVSAK
jgi:hypothetical protein